MWRNLTLALFLFILAQAANATSKLNFDHQSSVHSSHTLQAPVINLEFSFTALDDNSQEEHVNLPRLNRGCSSLFSHEIQLTPFYYLAITFFEIKLTTALFKNLTNPGIQISWFEKNSHQSNSFRISGWQDSNALYSSNINYYS